MRPQMQNIELPKQFTEQHLHQYDLMRMFNLTEPGFFSRYLRGEFPAGVVMTEFFDCNLIVWPRRDIEAWIAAGKPANVELADRRQRVIVALQNSIEAEHGIPIEQLAAEMVASSN